ncbi:hypothetical protein PHYPSEUDO_008996 [Phytophthora pseudosyringae]|uniref:Temptin Cys/Cys disulfide domain-containing protein n=1 Tax=Phytophthora pseudosyringae TaxID=221518 RepID=A0A8T1WCQ5_9STRA|nr:hypothetical protein PHYPSEUDO_008996 [Phytophthora pseudosyringae]
MKITAVGTTQLATALALLTSEADASKKFVKMIPSGGNVPDTPAIGHSDGTGKDASTNTFGDAFSAAGNKWTKDLCETDTDGDGQTNGQELGDPCCEWDMDTNPVLQWTDGVSHPDDATKTSDESLWANIVCGSASASVSESSETTEEDSSSATGNSTASSSAISKSSNSTPTSTTPPTSPSSQSSSTPSARTNSAPAPTQYFPIAAAAVVIVVVMAIA